MLRNYLTVAIRNLAANKLQSTINLGGLAVGLAACLLILLYVQDERSYEAWVPNADRIAAIEGTFYIPGREKMSFAAAPGPVQPAMLKTFSSDVERVVRVYTEEGPVRIGDRQFVGQTAYVDPGFFDVFDLPMVGGDRAAALANNASVVLSQRAARKYFGGGPAIGNTIAVGEDLVFTVVGVFADLPHNTHLSLEAIALLDLERYRARPWVAESWTSSNTSVYVLARSPAALDRIQAGMPAFIDANAHFDVPGLEDRPSSLMRFRVRPIRDIHLHADIRGYEHLGSYAVVVAFAAIAVLILMIAGINFVNLATARAMARAREVALRKVVGATRRQLVVQHLGEAMLTAVLALILAMALVELALPAFNGFLHKQLALDVLGNPTLALTMVGLVLAVGGLGGLYPALYLSRFRPAVVLKANRSSAHGSSAVRTGLVVFQFAISIALMACTATIYFQTRYARTLDLGFDHAARVSLHGVSDLPTGEARATLKRELAAVPGVRGVAMSSDAPPLQSNNNTLLYPTADTTGDKLIVETMRVDPDFFAVYGVAAVAGRLFDLDHAGDFASPDDSPEPRQGVVVNRAFVAKLGVRPEAAIGKVLWEINPEGKALIATTVVGVVPDLYLRSLRVAVTPMLYYVGRPDANWERLTVQLAPGAGRAAVRDVEAVWARVAPTVPIRLSYLDEDLGELYAGDAQRAQIFAGFALFAVVIACLGLFGLAAFAAERRTKEIGMRKVLGASVYDIVRLLVWQFSRPVLIAKLIAWPVAFYAMRRWLGGFRYAIALTDPRYLLPIFGGAAALALAIAWLTTAGHAYRVARANPGKALRVE